jgi:hypothetical protein
MQASKNPEEAYGIAKETGVTDSFEDFVAEMTKWHDSIKDLTEGDLDMVAGGSDAVSMVTVTLIAVSKASLTLATASVSVAAAAGA